jgi:UDP-N-acetyl-D-glucosamine dehydrogenase
MAESSFADRVAARDVTIGVVGLGYVGLPIAIGYTEAGFRTLGLDVDTELVDALNAGRSHVDDVSAFRVGRSVRDGRFTAHTDASALARSDVIFVCVPTPLDRAKTPDLSFLHTAIDTVADVLRPGMLVVLQSTTYPGTTVEATQPVLEAGGLRAGTDFHLAFSPERVDPGNTTWSVHNTPKVVGAVTPEGADRARLVLEAVMDEPGMVRIVSSPATAEMAKLLENTYRAVNIALVNELAMLAHEMGLDIWEVIDAAGTKPFGFEAFYPGVGPGGHCIPVDPYFLSWRARQFDFFTKFIELAADTNLSMADYIVHRIYEFASRLELGVRGLRVLCLGAAFKPGVSDIRNSRAIRVIEELDRAGARVDYADPMVPAITLPSGQRKAVELNGAVWNDVDLAVILTNDRSWPLDEIEAADVPLFDAVNAAGPPRRDRHERL